VLEARPRVVPSRRGLTLQPNGLDALQKLDLLEHAIRLGARANRVEWRQTNGAVLATLDYSILDHPYGYLLTIVPSELELALREEFSRRGGIFQESTSFRELSMDQKAVQVRAERLGSSVELSAQVIVGADGLDSKVREALQLPTRIKEYSEHYLFMLAGPAETFEQVARQYLGRGRMIGFFPTRGRTYIFYYLSKGELNELKGRGLATFKNELAGIEPDIADSLDTIKSWDDTSYAVPKRVLVGSW